MALSSRPTFLSLLLSCIVVLVNCDSSEDRCLDGGPEGMLYPIEGQIALHPSDRHFCRCGPPCAPSVALEMWLS
jgi:hypothetical protein